MSTHAGAGNLADESSHMSGAIVGMGRSYSRNNQESFHIGEAEVVVVDEVEVPDSEVALVVLAGDWGLPLLRDISKSTHAHAVEGSDEFTKRGDTTSGMGGDAKELGDHAGLVRGDAGHHYIPSGLIPVNGEAVVDDLLDHCRHVEKLNPVEKGVYVITNSHALEEFQAWANSDDLSGHDYPVENVISNGAYVPGEWKGDIDDLKSAIERFNLGSRPVIAVKADSLFHPGYNFNRLVAHAAISRTDCAFHFELDHAAKSSYEASEMMDDEGLITVTLKPGSPAVSRVATCSTELQMAQNLSEGTLCLGELIFLTTSTVSKLLDGTLDAKTIPTLASKIANTPSMDLRSIPLGHGYLTVKSLEGLHYAESFCASYMQKYNEINKLMVERMDTDSDVQLGEEQTIESRKAIALVLKERELHFKANFDASYFGDRAVRIGTKIRMVLPSKFYESEYGRTFGRVGPQFF